MVIQVFFFGAEKIFRFLRWSDEGSWQQKCV